MQDVRTSRGIEETPEGRVLSFAEGLRIKLNAINICRTALWKEIQRLGNWLELEAAGKAKDWNQSTVEIILGDGGGVASLRIGPRKYEYEFDGGGELWGFLLSVGIRQIILDARLDRNQVEDVMVMLYTFRRNLVHRKGGTAAQEAKGNFLDKPGVHIACTDVSIEGETLRMAYSYCTLRFSRNVRWFEQAHKNFRDHRALFHAAPRYAILMAIIVVGPISLYALFKGNWPLFSLSMLSTAILLGVIHYFFMIVGSVEYDNEEQAYRLQNAYVKLKIYTDCIQSDIQRARVVQQKLLPDPKHMPWPNRLDWASSFVPAEEVGGDYFDVNPLDDTRIVVLFSDVSGHGMAAAFITAIIKTSFQEGIDRQETLTELVKRMNATLWRLTPAESFAAVFLAIYDISTNRLSYVNGGHQPEPWWIPADRNKSVSSLSNSRNLLLGIEPDLAIVRADQMLAPGDIILFVSDGIVENRNVDGEFYGTDVFEEFLQAHRGNKVAELVRSIVEEAEAFSRDAQQQDDRTILAFQIKDH